MCSDIKCIYKDKQDQHGLLVEGIKIQAVMNKLAASTNPCLDHTVRLVYDALDPLVQIQRKDEIRVPISIEILITKYIEWRDQIVKDQITFSNLDDSIKPTTLLGKGFEEIEGQELVKQRLREGLIYPYQYTGLFPTHIRGVLLYGSPGTGKTILATAVYTELQIFFQQRKKYIILSAPTAGSLKGSYEGETESLIEALYASAAKQLQQPMNPPQYAIIIIDEADALMSEGRESDDSKKRTVNTFLQMTGGSDPIYKRIITIAITNFPQKIDTAMLRRLPLRLHVDLPPFEIRRLIIAETFIAHYVLPYMKDREQDDYEQLIYLFHDFGHKQFKITQDSIDSLSVRLGPRDTSDVQGLLKGRSNDEFSEDAYKELGFSPSDIVTGLQRAFNIASSRVVSAMENNQTSPIILRLPIEGFKPSGIPSDEYKYNPDEYHFKGMPYIYQPDYGSVGGDEYNTDVRKIIAKIPDSIITFDLRMEDIEQVFSTMASSIKKSEYEEILRWEQT